MNGQISSSRNQQIWRSALRQLMSYVPRRSTNLREAIATEPRLACSALALVMSVLLLTGCSGGGVQLAPVTGTVTVDGQPVHRALVIFIPGETEEGVGRPAYGTTDEKGHYTMKYTRDKAGALVGNHDVCIKMLPDEGEGEGPGTAVKARRVSIPGKFGNPGALTAKVSPKANVIDFALSSSD